ncbi:hypothetical protein [Nitrosospira sp. NRS527]|uniref:hypothetical protein n=1 Tax=Nitrosospira sp. NRS527 TaxID=155925 RepID=UPI001AF352CA|nr:hypothetical protein [Nitrosospira sp. NRS527]BCT68087.1 hypothetical protein NNRS527_01679 [Nitrosospira sp. NRS527]
MVRTPASDNAFFQALLGEDPLGAVVRAHIHVEARVYQVLAALTPHPTHLPNNLRYEQRIRMAVALGLNEEILQPLKVLGEIRNEFAHSLDVTLTDAMVERLWQAFSQEDQKIIREAYADTHAQLGQHGMPEYEKSDARYRFVMIAVAIDKYLIVEENEARNGHDVV